MNQTFNSEQEDELRDEYDFTKLPVVARGPGRKQAKTLTVALEPPFRTLTVTNGNY